MEVFSPSCANTGSSGPEITERICGILDAKTKILWNLALLEEEHPWNVKGTTCQ